MSDSEQMAELLARNAAMLDSMSQLLASTQQQLAQVRQLNRDLRARTGMAQSPDRMVTVVVDGVGGLRQLSLDRDAFEHYTPATLADAITSAVLAATRQSEALTPPVAEPSEIEPTDHLSPPETPIALVDPDPVLAPDPVPVPVLVQDPEPPATDQAPAGDPQIESVMSALSRLQSYDGVVTRVLGVRDPERAAAIAAEYQLGDTIVERTFLSTSANPAYTGDGLVRYTIDARHGGKLIGAISQDGEQFAEVVFGPGSTFRVTGKRYYPSIKGWDIALEELG